MICPLCLSESKNTRESVGQAGELFGRIGVCNECGNIWYLGALK